MSVSRNESERLKVQITYIWEGKKQKAYFYYKLLYFNMWQSKIAVNEVPQKKKCISFN